MRLKYQLFLTLLLFSVILIALMAAFSSWSFNRGFGEYMVEIEKRRLRSTIDALQDAYMEYQGWHWIENQPALMRELLRSDRRERRRPRPLPRDAAAPGRPPQKLLLVDHDRQLLFGRELPRGSVVWEPISADSKVVGYLGIRHPQGLPDDLDKAFAARQLRNYGSVAVAMAFLSVLLAVALASRIVKPILKINQAVGHIIGGDYRQRIESRRPDEIGDLSHNINQMAYTLEKNQNARQQWMAEISHELRTPVAVLQGELEALQDGINTLDEAAVASLHAESLRLGKLVDDLHELAMSDLGAMNYRMEPVDLAQLLRHRLQIGKTQTARADLSVSVDIAVPPLMIDADPQRIAQMIDNLLQNSVRYTDAGGQIDVVLSAQAGTVKLDWSDSAPGVDDAQLPDLFNSLYRTEQSRSRESGGSGLGLALVAKIVAAHQGSVEACHSDKGGLRICVSLPGRAVK